MDLINSMLWGLSGYDKALGRWVELRQHYVDSPLMQGHVDRAILHHIHLEGEKLAPDGLPDIATEAEQRCPNAEVTLRHVWDLAMHEYHLDALSSASSITHHLAVSLGGYALVLGTYSNFGTAPWRRFVTLIDQHRELADAQ